MAAIISATFERSDSFWDQKELQRKHKISEARAERKSVVLTHLTVVGRMTMAVIMME